MTGLTRQAKTLSDAQLRTLLRFVENETEFPERNRVVVLLSFKAGLLSGSRGRNVAEIRQAILRNNFDDVPRAAIAVMIKATMPKRFEVTS